MSLDVVAKSMALTFEPPSLTLIYSMQGKLREWPASSAESCVLPPVVFFSDLSFVFLFLFLLFTLRAGKRTMPIRGLRADSNPASLAQEVVRAHPSLLAPHLVSGSQIERLLKRLVEHKQVARAQHHAAERDARFLPSGQHLELLVDGVALEEELPEQRADLLVLDP